MFERLKYFFQNNKRLLLIIAGILIIILIIIFSIPWGQLFGKKKEAPVPVVTVPGNELVAEVATMQKSELTAEDKAAASVAVVAKNFAEIYGSYSNQSNYSNLEAVLPLLASRYRAEIADALQNFRASYKPSEIYEGTTTVVLSSATESLNDVAGMATVLVKTQRKISQGTQASYTVKYQDIRLDLIKEGGNWLVDNAKWIQ